MPKAKKKAVKRHKYAFPMDKVRKLRWVQKQILEEPKRLDMDCVVEKFGLDSVKLDKDYVPSCGTQACIAGWYGLKQFGKLVKVKDTYWDEKKEKDVEGEFWTWDVSEKREVCGFLDFMEEDLGLSTAVADSVFYTHSWPSPFQEQMDMACGNKKKEAKITVARIEHLINTGQ